MSQNDSPLTAVSRLEQAIQSGEVDAELVYPGVPTPTVPDAAAAIGAEERQIVKSLLFSDSQGNVVLAIVTGTSRVNRRRLSDVAGLGSLSLASPDVVLERTGYPAGGTPPVGHATRLDVIVDQRVMELPVAIGGGGRVDSLLRITPGEILRVTGARMADIADSVRPP